MTDATAQTRSGRSPKAEQSSCPAEQVRPSLHTIHLERFDVSKSPVTLFLPDDPFNILDCGELKVGDDGWRENRAEWGSDPRESFGAWPLALSWCQVLGRTFSAQRGDQAFDFGSLRGRGRESAQQLGGLAQGGLAVAFAAERSREPEARLV